MKCILGPHISIDIEVNSQWGLSHENTDSKDVPPVAGRLDGHEKCAGCTDKTQHC